MKGKRRTRTQEPYNPNRPFVIELHPPNTKGWYSIGNYRNYDEAVMQAELARQRTDRPVRVRDQRVFGE